MLKTKYWVGDQEIEIHELCLDYKVIEDSLDIILKDKSDKIDTLTRIVINDCFNIYLYWSISNSFKKTVEMLITPEKNIMFIGAGNISAQIDLTNSALINERKVNDFNYFSKYKNCIIEHCYGECTAFALDGMIINHHELDMMWEIEHIDGHFCTVCDYSGCRKLVKLET